MREVRPFYLVQVVWGDLYRDYFLEYCLPSLLAPGNIPSLAGRRPAKYLIATTSADWTAMRSAPIFRELERHATPIFLELPPASAEVPYWKRAILGHKLCCEVVARNNGYRIFTAPDAVYSDGMVDRLHDLALSGVEAVLKLVAPPAETTSFFATLSRMGLPAAGARERAQPLILSGRQLAAAALRSMHGSTVVNEWNSRNFCGYAATPWWRVPGEEGLVVFGMVWDLLLIDYEAVPHHDLEILDDRGFDGDYIMRNAGSLGSIYAVRDSDEISIVSWVSYADPVMRRHPLGELGKGVAFRKSYYGPMYNPLQRKLLFLPAYVHAGAVSGKFSEVQQDALRRLLSWLEPPSGLAEIGRALPFVYKDYLTLEAQIAAIRLPWWRRSAVCWGACRHCLFPLVALLLRIEASFSTRLAQLSARARRLGRVLRWNEQARQWWWWRVRKLAAEMAGRPFDESRPKVPE